MTTDKPTLWPPLDNNQEGGYKAFRVHVPEFDTAFEWHDQFYQKIWEGTAVCNLEHADQYFENMMLEIARAQTEQWKRVKLRRYAVEFYCIARVWAKEVRPTFESWVPEDGPLKDKYASDGS